MIDFEEVLEWFGTEDKIDMNFMREQVGNLDRAELEILTAAMFIALSDKDKFLAIQAVNLIKNNTQG